MRLSGIQGQELRQFSIGTRVRINGNYLKKYLLAGEFEKHKDYNVTGIVVGKYFPDNRSDFYEILWDDGKKESGYNRDFLQEVCDINMLMKELL